MKLSSFPLSLAFKLSLAVCACAVYRHTKLFNGPLCQKLRLNLKYRVTQNVAWHCWLNFTDTVLEFIDYFRCSQRFVCIGTLCQLPVTLAHIVWQSCLLLSLFNMGCQVTFVPCRTLSVARFHNCVSVFFTGKCFRSRILFGRRVDYTSCHQVTLRSNK